MDQVMFKTNIDRDIDRDIDFSLTIQEPVLPIFIRFR